MSNTSVPVTRATVSDFKVGRVFDRTLSVYTRNFLIFSVVTLIASAPPLLLMSAARFDPTRPDFGGGGAWVILLLTIVLTIALGLLSQAILVYGAFQDMRGRPVNLGESINVGLSRFFPIIRLTLLAGLGLMLGFMLIVPGVMLIVRWFVAVPVCMVERVGARQSLKRSAELTRGHRWKVFGIVLLLYMGAGVVSQVLTGALTAVGGSTLALIATLIWNTVWGAFFAIFVVVTYYELRVAKEGIDIEQIASVFD